MPEFDISRAFGFDLAEREGPERVEIRRSSLGVSLIPPGLENAGPENAALGIKAWDSSRRWLLVPSAGGLPQTTPQSRRDHRRRVPSPLDLDPRPSGSHIRSTG